MLKALIKSLENKPLNPGPLDLLESHLQLDNNMLIFLFDIPQHILLKRVENSFLQAYLDFMGFIRKDHRIQDYGKKDRICFNPL